MKVMLQCLLQFCTGVSYSVDEKFLHFQNIIICTKFNQLSFLLTLKWPCTLMAKYGHGAPESACIPNVFVISIQKMI